jgi:hypothetical protein
MSRGEPARGPTFLGIGAPRCGTTWLHRMLREHPEVWLPPIKEVHYFDSIDPALRVPHRIDRVTGRVRKHLVARAGHYAAAGVAWLKPSLRRRVRTDPAWDSRYFAAGGDIDWYNGLFEPRRRTHRAVGEITPAYFALTEPTIRLIAQRTAARRFLVMLRDPIDAAWSGLGKRVRDGKSNVDLADPGAVIADLEASGFGRRRYASNLRRWIEVVGRDALHVGTFEELGTDPAALLDRTCAFLGVAPLASRLGGRVHERVNASAGAQGEMPGEVARHLARRLEPELEALQPLVGAPAAIWLERARKLL